MKNKPVKLTLLALIISLVTVFGSVGCVGSSDSKVEAMKELENVSEIKPTQEEIEEEPQEEPQVEEPQVEDEPEVEQESYESVQGLQVHYLDVGQGDSIFIELPNKETLLIDGGTRSNGEIVLDYLSKLGVSNIDYVVATHPHEDHIGGLIEVINRHNIGKVYMPKVSHTTIAFEDLLLAIKNKDKKITSAKAGDMILDKAGLTIEILAPEDGCSDKNLNNHSVSIRLAYENNSFIFTGDAEKESESKMVARGHHLQADVLKVGHHGSNTSTTDSFLEKVGPKYAVISCGLNNTYGHPDDGIINKLKANNIEIFRTDLDGTIVASSDGQNISFDKKGSSIKSSGQNNITKTVEKSEIKPAVTDNIEEVYITNTGSKYHKGDCASVKKSKIPISLEKAKESYEPCKRCSP